MADEPNEKVELPGGYEPSEAAVAETERLGRRFRKVRDEGERPLLACASAPGGLSPRSNWLLLFATIGAVLAVFVAIGNPGGFIAAGAGGGLAALVASGLATLIGRLSGGRLGGLAVTDKEVIGVSPSGAILARVSLDEATSAEISGMRISRRLTVGFRDGSAWAIWVNYGHRAAREIAGYISGRDRPRGEATSPEGSRTGSAAGETADAEAANGASAGPESGGPGTQPRSVREGQEVPEATD